MRKITGLAVLIAMLLLLLPLKALSTPQTAIQTSTVENNQTVPKTEKIDSFKVYNPESEQTEKIERKEYIFGVVAAEMPALYHEEALKAQAVAAYTYAYCRKTNNSKKEYDITTDPTLDQNYISKEQAKEKWGDNADKYIEKLEKIIEETDGYLITCNGNPITAVYHAISSGKTEDCKNVWGSELSYLKPVSSESDKLAKGYKSTTKFSGEEIKEKLSAEFDLSGQASDWFSGISRTKSGTVSNISVCGKKTSGHEIRKLLNLRSANFDIKYEDDSFIFTVYGYGHCVGMSQSGADYMAKQGSDFKEILTHYYTDCKVEKQK